VHGLAADVFGKVINRASDDVDGVAAVDEIGDGEPLEMQGLRRVRKP
jgi:hypothetical protein